VGFVGKNCCVIVPGIGSHVLLATVLTDAELPADEPMGERCGSCRLCLDACPTRAFVGERALDARRCISYLTIEHAGPIEHALREPMGRWFLGCDACQDVCPYNRAALPDAATTAPFAPHPCWATPARADTCRCSARRPRRTRTRPFARPRAGRRSASSGAGPRSRRTRHLPLGARGLHAADP
jgi:epoxyqueuosine reductase